MKDLDEAAYILGIKIYRDRSIRLIGLSQGTYLGKVLKNFKMDQSKKGYLPVLQGVKLRKTQSPTMAEDRKRMKVIPYASVIGSIKLSCYVPNRLCALLWVWQGGTIVIQKWICIAVKVILSYLRGLRKYFSVMEVIKSPSWSVTLMQAFTLIHMTLSLNLDTFWKWEQLARVAPCRAL